MEDLTAAAENFLTQTFADFGLQLKIKAVRQTEESVLFDLEGADFLLLTQENGELLDTFEYLLNQVIQGLPDGKRFVCDADGVKQIRRAELLQMARFAADKVRKNGVPFTFGKLTALERRAVHMALSIEEDIQTVSVGEGRERRLRVELK